MPTVQAVFRYPIKGLSAEALHKVTLAPAKTCPGDRRFALRHAASAFNAAHPTWQRKSEFLMLAHTAELAKLHTALDPETGVMHIHAGGSTLFVGNVFSPAGRRGAEHVFNATLNDPRGPIQLIDAGSISLTDVEPPYVSIINPASVRDLAQKAKADIEPARFRGNILVDDLAPWAEFDWVGRTIHIGGVQFKVIKRIQRCAATHVNLQTAVRDLNVTACLRDHVGHMDCGIYAEVVSGGIIQVNDTVTPL